ncbi:hypothetical protein Vadar_029750 [Vaccinium darrowii]|uniref:Uncharacterized protein n=1 Tax=Vaccinium darrowii TaxID=229202 RepID=A0ACB7Z7E8_9ERIC|nr:hypothetical protein Vadar_029750 [Vaccinium darrowii]
MNGQKSRTKALKIAVGVHGVESAALAGQDKNQIEVIGDGIDSVALTTLLRKNVGFSELVSVGPVPEKKDGGSDQKKDVAMVQIPLTEYYNYNYSPYAHPYAYEIRDQNPDNSKGRNQSTHERTEVSHQSSKIAVGVHGVESAALAGQDKNQIEVIGDGIDSVALTTLLRKNVGYSELVSVGPVPEKKDGGGNQKENEAPVPIPLTGYYNYNYPYAPPYGYEIRDENSDNCSIM